MLLPQQNTIFPLFYKYFHDFTGNEEFLVFRFLSAIPNFGFTKDPLSS